MALVVHMRLSARSIRATLARSRIVRARSFRLTFTLRALASARVGARSCARLSAGPGKLARAGACIFAPGRLGANA